MCGPYFFCLALFSIRPTLDKHRTTVKMPGRPIPARPNEKV